MLGKAQLAWLEETLARADEAPLVVLVSGVPWITNRKWEPLAGWRKYSRERQRIANHIHRLGLTSRVVMLSGDAHMVAMDDGRNNRYVTLPDAPERGFPVIQAAPLDRKTSRKGGPSSLGVSRERGQFGLLEVEDDGEVLTARPELHGPRPRARPTALPSCPELPESSQRSGVFRYPRESTVLRRSTMIGTAGGTRWSFAMKFRIIVRWVPSTVW